MNEGDVVTVFSQFGEITDCYMVRDKDTGEPKGFCFLAYEDQRSTDLAVDNLNGTEVCGRKLKVDHCHFKIPKEFIDPKKREKPEDDKKSEKSGSGSDSENDDEIPKKLYTPSGPDGLGWGEFRREKQEENNSPNESQEKIERIDENSENDDEIEKTPIYNQPEEQKNEEIKKGENIPKIADDDENVFFDFWKTNKK